MNERKRQVLYSAQQLFVKKGFTSTSIQDILNESQISKGTFYNYFSSKNECLIAILDLGQEETIIRRQELLIGRDISDKIILAEQISIRQQVNRDHNLFPIFEAIFHSGDPELSSFAKKNHVAELRWLAGRLVDVYGKPTTPHASDCAVLMLGMLHHMQQARSASSTEEVDTLELVKFIMRRMDSIIPTMIETEDPLLEEGLFELASDNINKKVQTKKQLLKQLTAFRNTLNIEEQPNDKEYLDFLSDEINSAHPRSFLLETVTRSFRESFIDTPHEFEARKLASDIWLYIETFKEK